MPARVPPLYSPSQRLSAQLSRIVSPVRTSSANADADRSHQYQRSFLLGPTPPRALSPRALRRESTGNSRLQPDPRTSAYVNSPAPFNNLGLQVPSRVPRTINVRKPIVTIVSALPKTVYTDEEHTKNRPPTLKYLQVQLQVLDYLRTNAADSITPTQAHRWTQTVDPGGYGEPLAHEALRLCYYMRSQGFDVYAKFFFSKTFELFVVNQLSNIRGEGYDHLYWRQNFITNEIENVFQTRRTDNTWRHNMSAMGTRIPTYQERTSLIQAILRGGDEVFQPWRFGHDTELDDDTDIELESSTTSLQSTADPGAIRGPSFAQAFRVATTQFQDRMRARLDRTARALE